MSGYLADIGVQVASALIRDTADRPVHSSAELDPRHGRRCLSVEAPVRCLRPGSTGRQPWRWSAAAICAAVVGLAITLAFEPGRLSPGPCGSGGLTGQEGVEQPGEASVEVSFRAG